MQTKNLLWITAALLLFTACGKKYTVTAECDASSNGKQAYIIDYTTEKPLDSTIVSDNKAIFEGETPEAKLCQFFVNSPSRESATFILESGNIVIDPETQMVSGTAQNDSLQSFNSTLRKTQEQFYTRYQALSKTTPDFKEKVEALQDEMMQSFGDVSARFIESMPGSCVATYALANWLPMLIGTENFDKAAAYITDNDLKYPMIKNSVKTNDRTKATQAGAMFTDFTIENGNLDGSAVSLSDYVGKGNYVLVDFWASWCGPCPPETPDRPEICKQFGGDDFEIVSVAVWDERDATLEAIKELALPWPQIIDAGQIPTDLYGINGIPQIMLFAPDGTIVARNLRGEEMKRLISLTLQK